MLKLIIMLVFMIPLILNYTFLCNMIAITTFIFMLFYNSNFFMIGYTMHIDKISFGLIMLSMWITILMIISSINHMKNKMFSLMILTLLFLLIMSFCSSSLVMFYIFFKASLIPTIVIIMGWGYQPERMIASYYLLFYTLFASLLIYYYQLCILYTLIMEQLYFR